MIRRLLCLAAVLAACGGSTVAVREDQTPAGVLELISPEPGNVDAFGHVMLPAGVHANCEVHNVPLADDVIAVLNGLPYIDTAGYSAAQRKDFPHDATLYYGGCVGRGSWAAVSYCSACRAAELAWEQAVAASGKKHSYDAAMRAQIRADIGVPPPIPAQSPR